MIEACVQLYQHVLLTVTAQSCRGGMKINGDVTCMQLTALT
jgi:hypothetical protein